MMTKNRIRSIAYVHTCANIRVHRRVLEHSGQGYVSSSLNEGEKRFEGLHKFTRCNIYAHTGRRVYIRAILWHEI